MSLLIDARSGELSESLASLSIGPSTSLQLFLRSDLGSTAKRIRKGRYFYSIHLRLDEQLTLGIVLLFSKDSYIEQLNLKFFNQFATEWSRKEEDEARTKHDRWLTDQFGLPPYHFHWGTVSSVIDAHGYSAVVKVIYRKFTREEYYAKERSAVSMLIGARVRSVNLTGEQVEFSLSEEMLLIGNILPDLNASGEMLNENNIGYKLHLDSIVGRTITGADFTDAEDLLSLRFGDDLMMRFRLGSYEGNGERAVLHGPDNFTYMF